ncbi:MAG: 6-phosphogluconolactonase [Rhodopseudomonas palustris]|nr:6-phosphogluconolactonase [Rhodopseudomonas palustris]
MNFGMGLTRVRFGDYMLGTGLGILVGTFIFTFFIGTLKDVWASGTGESSCPSRWPSRWRSSSCRFSSRRRSGAYAGRARPGTPRSHRVTGRTHRLPHEVNVTPDAPSFATELRVEADIESAWRTAADAIADAVTAGVAAAGTAAIAVSGGGTPRGLHRLLAEPPWVDAIPWDRLHMFWADERLVPYDDPPAITGRARLDWLDRLAQAPAGGHPVPVGLPPEAAVIAMRTSSGLASEAAGRPDRFWISRCLESGRTALRLALPRAPGPGRRPPLDGGR